MKDLRRFQVGPDAAAARLDVYLAARLGLSRGYVRRLLGRGWVRLGGRPARKGDLLRPGDRIEVRAFRHPETGVAARSDRRLPELAASSDYLAFDKPAGLASRPLDWDDADTAVGAALRAHPELARVGGPLECGIVHRLDEHTSGVLVFARSQESWERARQAFSRREVRKSYRARVHGRLEGSRALELRIAHRRGRMRSVTHGGREVEIAVRSARVDGGTTLLDLATRTGAMHQIRAALAEIGHPIVGDRLYGSPDPDSRYWLHATWIAIGPFEASAPLPDELV